jgi:hypothetical protein
MARQCKLRPTLPFPACFLYNPKFHSQPITQFATCFHTGILLSLFDPEDGGELFLWNAGRLSMDYKALYPRRKDYSYPLLLWEPQILNSILSFPFIPCTSSAQHWRVKPSKLQCHTVQRHRNVSKEHTASIFSVKEQGKHETSISRWQAGIFDVQFTQIVTCLVYSTLEMEVHCSFIMSGSVWTTQCYTSQKTVTLHTQCWENPKSNICIMLIVVTIIKLPYCQVFAWCIIVCSGLDD